MRIWRDGILLYIGGMLYVAVELLWRGWSHPSMFLVGGMCFLLIGGINEGLLRREMPLPEQALLGALIVTVVELISGLVINGLLRLNVWDYSGMPYNFHGQICLGYFLLWIPLSGVAVIVDDWLRHWLFHERRPSYHWLPETAALHRGQKSP